MAFGLPHRCESALLTHLSLVWLLKRLVQVLRYLACALTAWWLWKATISSPAGLTRTLRLIGSAMSLGLLFVRHRLTFITRRGADPSLLSQLAPYHFVSHLLTLA